MQRWGSCRVDLFFDKIHPPRLLQPRNLFSSLFRYLLRLYLSPFAPLSSSRRPSVTRASRVESRERPGPMVPRADSNSISHRRSTEEKKGEEEEKEAFAHCTLPAYISVIGNKFRNKLPVTSTTHREKARWIRRGRDWSIAGGIGQRTSRKANNNNNYLIRVDGREKERKRGEGRGRAYAKFVISVMGCSTRVTCRPALN